MTSDTPTDGRCNAQTRDDGYCEAYPVSDSERCRMHGGSTPTKAENPKQGAPVGSANAQKHALHADRSKFYNRLSEERQGTVDQLEGALIERYVDQHGRDPDPADVKDVYEIAVGYVLRDYARDYLAEQMGESGNPMLEHVEYNTSEGEHVEYDKVNDILEQIDASRREDRMARKDKNLENDPTSQLSDSLDDQTELWREVMSGEGIDVESVESSSSDSGSDDQQTIDIPARTEPTS